MKQMQSKLDGLMKGAAVALALVIAAASRAAAQGTGEPPILLSPDSMWKQRHNLRVCADPQNLPFSNNKREGFDNKIADVIARELGDSVSYAWWPSRRGYLRNTLSAGKCDVVIGVQIGFDPVATS
jgi:mxaJ protein